MRPGKAQADIESVFRTWGHPWNREVLLRLVSRFPDPVATARGVVAFAREMVAWAPTGVGDASCFLNDTFRTGRLDLLTDTAGAPLLHFAPTSRAFRLAAEFIPEILNEQIEALFPGVGPVVTRLMSVDSSCSLLALVRSIGFEDVKTGVMGATTGVYHLQLADGRQRVLKRTDMRLERLASHLLETIFSLPAVQIDWSGPAWSIMQPVTGASLRQLSGNPLTEPRRCLWNPSEVGRVARELGRESALAHYLHLFSRHSGNILVRDPDHLATAEYVRIDFGQSLLSSRMPRLEAIMPLWHLRRFFPGSGTRWYEMPEVVAEIAAGFLEVAAIAREAAPQILRVLDRAVGLPVPEMAGETGRVIIDAVHVAEVGRILTEETLPTDTFNAIYNHFYQDGWQVPGWTEYGPPRERMFEEAYGHFDDLLTPRDWARLAAGEPSPGSDPP